MNSFSAILPKLTLRSVYWGGIILAAFCICYVAENGYPLMTIFWHLIALQDVASAWFMLAMLVMGLAFRGDAAWVQPFILRMHLHHRALIAIAWGLMMLGTVFVYQTHPLSMDEYAAYFQAQVFAAGKLHGQFPPQWLDLLIPPEFQNYFLYVNRETGAVVSAYWPGFSILLAPFVWAGIPWACNPTLTALGMLLIHGLTGKLLKSEEAQGWALLFTIASPVILINGMSFYSMPAHLLLNLMFVALLIERTKLSLFLAGLVGGFALSLHNPFPHALFALPWLIHLLAAKKDRLPNILMLVAGYLPVVMALCVGWYLWRMDLLQPLTSLVVHGGTSTPVEVHGLFDKFVAIVKGINPISMPDEFIFNARIAGVVKIVLWGAPLLLLLAAVGARVAWRDQGYLRLITESMLMTLIGYFFVKFTQGHGWGYRYFHSVWGVLPILAACAVMFLREAELAGRAYLPSLVMISLVSLVFFNGSHAYQVKSFMDSHLAQLPPLALGSRVVMTTSGKGYYAKDLIQNDPWLRGERIMLIAQDVNGSDVNSVTAKLGGCQKIMKNEYGATCVLNRSPDR